MNHEENVASNFVSFGGIVLLIILILVSNYGRVYQVTGFLLFFLLLCLTAWRWGKKALNQLKIEIETQTEEVFPEQILSISLAVENQKTLPVVWLDMVLPMAKKECIMPEEEYERRTYTDSVTRKTCEGMLQKFTWIMWHQKLSWDISMKACKRGVLNWKNVELFSGDGFGLSVNEQSVLLQKNVVIFVYPRKIPVNVEPILRNCAEAVQGNIGNMEDITILKSIRPYQPGDSAKKINWRLLAKQDSVQVNVYEKISPRCVCFFLDLGSFRKIVEEINWNVAVREVSVLEDALEEMISLIGSCIIKLSEMGISCAMVLPGYGEMEEKIIIPEDIELQEKELLQELAKINYQGEDTRYSEEEILQRGHQLGQIYMVLYNMEKQEKSCVELMECMGRGRVFCLVHEMDRKAMASEYEVLQERKLRMDE